jgi:hypothetical protein
VVGSPGDEFCERHVTGVLTPDASAMKAEVAAREV